MSGNGALTGSCPSTTATHQPITPKVPQPGRDASCVVAPTSATIPTATGTALQHARRTPPNPPAATAGSGPWPFRHPQHPLCHPVLARPRTCNALSRACCWPLLPNTTFLETPFLKGFAGYRMPPRPPEALKEIRPVLTAAFHCPQRHFGGPSGDHQAGGGDRLHQVEPYSFVATAKELDACLPNSRIWRAALAQLFRPS